ncbi:hypothetical protein DFJ73DRAFT_781768 [Zopfochytrium polystomum]|nr:hypothetical protein DFJ73DRAFT_781768 [Zopfochytrium polystomum]
MSLPPLAQSLPGASTPALPYMLAQCTLLAFLHVIALQISLSSAAASASRPIPSLCLTTLGGGTPSLFNNQGSGNDDCHSNNLCC